MPRLTPFEMRLELLRAYMLADQSQDRDKEKTKEDLIKKIFLGLTPSQTNAFLTFFKLMIERKHKLDPKNKIPPTAIDMLGLYNQVSNPIKWTKTKILKTLGWSVLIDFAFMVPFLLFFLCLGAPLSAYLSLLILASILLLPTIAIGSKHEQNESVHPNTATLVKKIQNEKFNDNNLIHRLLMQYTQDKPKLVEQETMTEPEAIMVVSSSLVALSGSEVAEQPVEDINKFFNTSTATQKSTVYFADDFFSGTSPAPNQ